MRRDGREVSAQQQVGGLSQRVIDVGWDMQALYDADGTYLEVSAASERLFGWRPDELVGTSSYDYFHPDDLAAIRAAHDQVLDDPAPATVTYRLRCKDGSYRWVEVIGVGIDPGDGGAPGRIHCATRDVTERVRLVEELRRVSEELRDREERFRLAQYHSGIGWSLVALDGTFIDANPAICRILGRTEAELLEHTFQELTHPDDLEADLVQMRALLDGTSDGYEIDKRYLRPDGTEIPIQLNGTVVRAADGTPRYFVAQVQDLSDRRRAAEAEQAIEASHRLQLVGRLAADTAHHFNNLLAEMSIDLELVEAALASEPAVGRDAGVFLGRLRRSLRTATGITRGLQVLGGQDPSDATDFDLCSAVDDVAQHLRHVLGSGVAIDLDLPAGVGPVHADRERIETALLSMVLNASEAITTGGHLRVTVEEVGDRDPTPRWEMPDDRATAAASGSGPRRWIVLRVVDDGVGMSPDTLERCTDLFFTTRPGRAGIGLSVARNVALAAGGELVLRSEVGHGTTAELWLPRSDSAGSGPVPSSEPDLLSVLVVDDRVELLDLVAIALRRSGCVVRPASGSAAALELVERDGEHVDVVVTDIVMPAMAGPKLAQRLRRTLPALGVVFMSGYSDLADQVQSVPRSRFLAKPFSVEDLLAAVRQVAVTDRG